MLLRGIPFWRLLTKVDKSEDNVSSNILGKKKTRIELNFGTNVHTHSCPHSFFSFCVCSRQNQTLTSAFNLVENAYIYVSNGWYQHSYFVLYIQVCSSWSVCWKDTLNFIRLLRVVITPSVTSDVVERRKRSNRMNFRLLERMIVSTGRCENNYSTISTWCWFNCNSTNIIHVGFVQAECYKNCLEVT